MDQVFSVLAVVFTLIFLEGILSIDNAAVIAAMANKLPADRPAPAPVAWLGSQRTAALKAGLFGALVLRAVMLLFAGVLIRYPVVHVIGALYLLLLVVEHFTDFNPFRWAFGAVRKLVRGSSRSVQRESNSFWSVVASIELADLAFSIDNVVAAVALSPVLWVVLLGVSLGIVTMRFAAAIFQWLIVRVPSMEHGAYLLLLAIAGELLAEEFLGIHLNEVQTFLISFSIILGVIAYDLFLARPRRTVSPISDELRDQERLLEGKNLQ